MKKLLLSLTFAAMSSAALAAEPLTAQQGYCYGWSNG